MLSPSLMFEVRFAIPICLTVGACGMAVSTWAEDPRPFAVPERAAVAADRTDEWLDALPDDGPRAPAPAPGTQDPHFQEAMTAYARGDVPRAAEAFHRSLEQAPRGPLSDACRAFLAELLAQSQGSPRYRLEAIAAYQELLRHHPGTLNASRARWRIGDLYAKQGWYAEAQVAYERAIKESLPLDAERALLGLGAMYLTASKWNEAEQTFRLLQNRTADPPLLRHARLGLADALASGKRFTDALPLYESLLAQWPDVLKQHPFSLLRFAGAARTLRREPEARHLYATFYNLHPHHPGAGMALVEIGDSLRRTDALQQARFFYATAMDGSRDAEAATLAQMRLGELAQTLLAREPGRRIHTEVQLSFHDSLRLSPSAERQRALFATIADAHPDDAMGSEARFHLGEHFEWQQQWSDAVERYREVSDRAGLVADDPWPERAGERLVLLLKPWIMAALQAGDDFTAVTLFHRHGRAAERIYAGSAAFLQIADAHRRLGFVSPAIKLYQALIRHPESAPWHEASLIGLGQAYLDQDDAAAARRVFERYRIQYPLGQWNAEALRFIADAYRMQGQPQEVIRICRQWIRLYGATAPSMAPAIRLMLTNALVDKGDRDAALDAYADAFRVAGATDPIERLRYGDLLSQATRDREAAAQYEAVLYATPPEQMAGGWARIQLARLWRRQARYADAARLLEPLIAASSDDVLVRASAVLQQDLARDRARAGGEGS